MAKLRLEVELDYDADATHGGDEDSQARKWFFEEILLGEYGELVLHSSMIGDAVGDIRVLRVAKEPEKNAVSAPVVPVTTAVPVTDVSILSAAVAEFERRLPGWWWSVGSCIESRDASCGPDISGPDADLLKIEDRVFDEAFHCDDHRDGSTVADVLRAVMEEALETRARFRG